MISILSCLEINARNQLRTLQFILRTDITNNVIFHRVIDQFMIQTGDPLGKEFPTYFYLPRVTVVDRWSQVDAHV